MPSLPFKFVIASWLAPGLASGAILVIETSHLSLEPSRLLFPTDRVEFTFLRDLADLHIASTKQEKPIFDNPAAFLGRSPRDKQSSNFTSLFRGKQLISAQSFEKAELAVEKVLSEDPKLPEALLLSGVAKAGQGLHEKALIEFEKVLALGEDNAALRQSRGISFLALGRKKEAEIEFSRAIEHDSKFAQAYVKRGVLRGSLGNYKEAAADFSRFIDLRPNSPIGYKNRALALIKMGRQADAQPDIIRAQKLEKK